MLAIEESPDFGEWPASWWRSSLKDGPILRPQATDPGHASGAERQAVVIRGLVQRSDGVGRKRGSPSGLFRSGAYCRKQRLLMRFLAIYSQQAVF